MKLYHVTGTAYGWYREKDEFGIPIKTEESATGSIDTIIRAVNEGLASDMALKQWRLANDWPNAIWDKEPEVSLAPEDQQMQLIGAPRLPGMEG